MSQKTINVFLNTQNTKKFVGQLAMVDGKIYFEYDTEFLKNGIELSPYKLSLKTGVQVCEDRLFEGLYGLFADSLPDGWGRLLLDRHLVRLGKAYGDITPLDRLSYIGNYGIGALSYEPVVDDVHDIDDNIVLDDLAYSSLEVLEGSSEDMIDTLLTLGGSSAGARPKAVIQLDKKKEKIIHGAQSLHEGYEHYLVKFASSLDSKEIGIIEYIYSLMAKDSGLEMMDTQLLEGKKGRYFATKRFDRVGDRRVHIHSVAGLTHSDFRMPVLDYDDLLALTLHLTKDVNEQLKMFRLAVFNLFAHNRDDHAKNFSYLLDENNQWKLAPAYDLTFSYGPGEEHSTTYLGEGKHPGKEHLMKLASIHGIKNATTIIEEIEVIVKNFAQYAQKLGMAKHSIRKIEMVLNKTMKN
jgi:serine/threonine-protein kinase HipA